MVGISGDMRGPAYYGRDDVAGILVMANACRREHVLKVEAEGIGR